MNNRLLRGTIGLLLGVALLLSAGCGSGFKHLKLVGEDPEYLWLEWELAGGQVVAQQYEHPGSLTVEQLLPMLAAVRIEEHSFFKWRDQGPLFTEDAATRLAGWLAEGLKQASGDQWVRFAVISLKRKLLFKDSLLTDGICYVKDGKLNLIFGNIDYPVSDPDAQFYRLDPRDRTVLNALRLKTDPASGYDAPPVVKNDKWLDTPRRNWLVFDPTVFAAKPAEAVAPEAVTPAPAPAPVKEDAAARLQKLKELFDQGLITQEEYDRKRQEILGEI